MKSFDEIVAPEVYAVARALPADAMTAWAEAIRAMLPRAAAGRRALDLGCGTGRFLGMLADLAGGPAIGLDPSVSMLAHREAGEPRPRRVVAGRAEALPVGGAAIDLVFMSMVYHHLTDVSGTLREARRVLRAGGHVVVRNATREAVEEYEFLRFFPEAKAIDLARMPARQAVVDAFASLGFATLDHRIVRHRFAASPREYARKIGRRGLSSLGLISDEAFAEGLRRLERHCRTMPPDEPIDEPVDLFVFQRGPAP